MGCFKEFVSSHWIFCKAFFFILTFTFKMQLLPHKMYICIYTICAQCSILSLLNYILQLLFFFSQRSYKEFVCLIKFICFKNADQKCILHCYCRAKLFCIMPFLRTIMSCFRRGNKDFSVCLWELCSMLEFRGSRRCVLLQCKMCLSTALPQYYNTVFKSRWFLDSK